MDCQSGAVEKEEEMKNPNEKTRPKACVHETCTTAPTGHFDAKGQQNTLDAMLIRQLTCPICHSDAKIYLISLLAEYHKKLHKNTSKKERKK